MFSGGRVRLITMAAGVLLVGAALAYAQGDVTTLVSADGPGAPAGAIDAEGRLPTLIDLFLYSKYINGILAGLSVLAVALFLVFLLTINSRAMAPADLVDELTKLAVAGHHDKAVDLCRRNRGVFIASVIQRCVENADKSHGVMMDMLDTEGKRRAEIVWNRVSYLADISNVAPMLGLLGTVLGMIKAFFLLEKAPGNVLSKSLASGVGEAMATTMFGLVVGIAALVMYSLVKSRATRSLAEAEAAVHAIADHVKRDQR